MAYGALLKRAWQLVWNHRYLVVIGASAQAAAVVGMLINSFTGVLGSLFMMAAIILVEAWLITAIFQVLDTGQSGYQVAWDAMWPKKWRVAGVLLLAGLPGGLIGTLFGGAVAAVWAVIFLLGYGGGVTPTSTLLIAGGVISAVLFVAMIIVALPFSILGRGAVIACLHEDTDMVGSFSRAWQVFRPNIGPLAVLLLIQIAINLPLALIILLPLGILSICPLIWPVSWLAGGLVSAWWTAVWALAWEDWAKVTTNLAPVRT